VLTRLEGKVLDKDLSILRRPSAGFINYEAPVRAPFKELNQLIKALTKLNRRKDLVQTSIAGRVGVCEAVRTMMVKVLKVEPTRPKRGLRVSLLVIVKYRGVKPKARLKADRYLVNLTLDQGGLRLSIGLVKGLMRTDPDELAHMIVGSITSS